MVNVIETTKPYKNTLNLNFSGPHEIIKTMQIVHRDLTEMEKNYEDGVVFLNEDDEYYHDRVFEYLYSVNGKKARLVISEVFVRYLNLEESEYNVYEEINNLVERLIEQSLENVLGIKDARPSDSEVRRIAKRTNSIARLRQETVYNMAFGELKNIIMSSEIMKMFDANL